MLKRLEGEVEGCAVMVDGIKSDLVIYFARGDHRYVGYPHRPWHS